jgi:hypothetical protein
VRKKMMLAEDVALHWCLITLGMLHAVGAALFYGLACQAICLGLSYFMQVFQREEEERDHVGHSDRTRHHCRRLRRFMVPLAQA